MDFEQEHLQQVKNKIEFVLLQKPSVEDCTVIVRETETAQPELVVYIVSRQPLLPEQLRSYLQGVVPETLLPKSYVPVSNLSSIPTGEVDEIALRRLPVVDESELKPLALSDGGPLPDDPHAPATLPEVLERAAREVTGNCIVYLKHEGEEVVQSYAELLAGASRILAGLRQLGLRAGDKVILLLERNPDTISAFWGCILGGFVPVIMEVPPTYQESNPALDKLRHIWEFLDAPLIITTETLQDSVKFLSQRWADLRVCSIDALSNNEPDRLYYSGQPDDLAFLNLTSGSTGMPKCIQLTHRNIIARARGTNILNQHKSDEVILNWLPFDHIGSICDWHIRCVVLGCTVVYVQKEYILGRALNWLDLIDKYRITHSWAPNFAYALVDDLLEQQPEQNWDLSCVQFLLTAGEAISSTSVKDCLEKMTAYGFKKTAIRPAFGMAELGSGITYYQPSDKAPLTFHRVEKSSLEGRSLCSTEGTSAPQVTSTIKRVEADHPNSTIFADLGPVIPGVVIRIVDNDNAVLPEDTIGCLQVKGDTVFPGYYKNPEANQEAFLVDGWFNTGDLGFICNGQLVITGRVKETIIINGVNYYSHEIEAVVEEIEGVEVSYTAACAVQSADGATENLAIFFNCSSEVDEELRKALLNKIRRMVVSKVGVYASYLIPVAKEVIPKTAIGKIQRQQLSKRFEAGEFDPILKQLNILLKSDGFYSATNAEIEGQIAKIWQKVLGLEEVRIHDNFFELGGHSLLLLQVQCMLHELFGCQVSVVDMFRYPTISALAKYFSQEQTEKTATEQGEQRSALRRSKWTSVGLDVAVIGMSCRFPGANTIDEFWQNLCNGVESISFFTDEEVLASGVEPELLKNPNYVKANPILSDVESFDAEFFGYSPKEAELIDPQQRLLLECAWQSLEDAGYNPLTYKGAIGIYAGAVMNTYLLNNIYPNRHQLDSNESMQVVTLDSIGGFQIMVANDKDYLTTRVSYKLNLTGPSVNVQTACSTSLVAIHMASQSLLNGECDMVLAGGVSVQVPQKIGYLYKEGTIISPDGHCRAFDEQARGTIFGSGVGIVVLKRLEEAIADRDHIYAVIKGSAINNDGGTKVGYLAPNGDGQARVATEAMAMAGVEAEMLGYVETHGTGTALGDPIEIAGLTQAFRASTQKKRFCAIGSVKTNVGHLQIASGVVGFIKTVLSLHHKELPASLHFEKPNPKIDFANSPFYVNTTLKNWQTTGHPRRAGVNSLGVGGTNVHVILEEAPAGDLLNRGVDPQLSRPLHLLTLSAKSKKALQEMAQRYEEFLAKHPLVPIADVCFTANTGRSHFDHRLAVVASSIMQLREQLNSFRTGKEAAGLMRGQASSGQLGIAFLFTDQESQYIGMGRQLYETQPTFRQTLDRCDEILRLYLDKPLLEVLFGSLSPCPPALFALEYAVFSLWKSWGIEPTVVIGNSVGEYVAACVAGVFSLEDGLKLITAQGRSKIQAFEQVAREVTYSLPRLDLISNITGELVTAEIATPDYWCRHRGQPVKFTTSMETLHWAGYDVFVECGYADWQKLLESLADLYVRGVAVDWFSFDQDYPRRKMTLPTYPFQRQRYWIEAALRSRGANSPLPLHPLLGQRLPSALKEILFQSQLSQDSPAFLKDHRVYQKAVLPGAAYLEMALAAGAAVLKSSHIVLEDLVIQQALILPEEIQTVQLIMSKESTGSTPLEAAQSASTFQIYSLVTGDEESQSWKLHCSGKIVVKEDLEPERVNLACLRGQFADELSVETHYQQFHERGIDYGLSFQAIEQLWGQEGEALGWIRMPALAIDSSVYQLHPVLLDACFQVVFAALPQAAKSETYLPVGLERLRVYRRPGQNLWSHVCLRPVNGSNQQILIADLRLFDETGNLVIQVDGLSSKRASRKALLGPEKFWQDWYEVEWRPQTRDEGRETRGEGSWLILADEGGIGQQLAALLRSKQQVCILAFPGKKHESPEQFHIDPIRSDFQRLLDTLRNEQPPLHGVIHLWSLDAVEAQFLTGTDLEVASRQGCMSTLHLIQALVKAGFSHPPRLWLVTQGAQPVGLYNPDVPGIAQSSLWGMGKVIALEHPELNCVRVDLDPRSQKDDAQALFEEIWSPDVEDQIAFRDGIRQVARLVRSRLTQEEPEIQQQLNAPSNQSLRLEISNRGTLDNLKWQPTSRRQPGPGEVEIQVRTTGLNFRDVLNALGLYPGDPGYLGLECAGEVVTIGKGVKSFGIGDAVMAIAPGSFSQYVTVDAALVVSKPNSLSFEEAATIPGAFLTAYYTLYHLAKISAGDRVLIHAATGGVGLAAVQLAQQAGAEVFATASPGKWEFLKSLGVEHIMNSRTLDFADEVMSITQGKGVDIVLNSLAAEFIPKSLSVLSAKGRFVEIGKQGVWEPSQVAYLKPDVSYFVFDLVQLTQQQPTLIQLMLRQLIQQFQVGLLKPLPHKQFPMHRVVDAFRYMQQAKHIGKIVGCQPSEMSNLAVPPSLVRGDGTYVITGGLGDLGLLVAQWLVAQGAKYLVLVGRSSPKDTVSRGTPPCVRMLRELEQAGAKVVIAQADVADAEQIAQVLADVEQSLPPLRGVVHAAGLLDDGILQQQSWERFERVMAPKVQGAWNLHVLTQNYPLDFFVMFSSVASLLGSAGQANYSAANAFLDALAYARTRMGLPGLSINWGAWSQIGVAAKRQMAPVGSKGMGTITPQQGLAVLEQLLSQPPIQVGVVSINWSQWIRSATWPFLADFATEISEEQPLVVKAEFLQQLEAATKSNRRELLVAHVRSQVIKVLGLNSLDSTDIQQGFSELGMDSLTSVELRNRLQSSLVVTLPSTLAFDYPTVAALADYLAEALFSPASIVESLEDTEDLDKSALQMQQLSEAEAEALLLDELENLNY